MRLSIRMLLLVALVPACSSAGARVTPESGSGTSGHVSDGGPNATPGFGRAPANHRPVAVACPRSPSGAPSYAPPDAAVSTNGACAVDTECAFDDGHAGHCAVYADAGSKECNYDDCFTDSDCSGGLVCTCSGNALGQVSGPGNKCFPGNCRVDADCGAGGYCSPSEGPCGAFNGIQGWYCHTATDQCLDDSDCANASASPGQSSLCVFTPEVGDWGCTQVACAG